MNLDDITIGQLKDLQSLIGAQSKQSSLFQGMIGKYVVVLRAMKG